MSLEKSHTDLLLPKFLFKVTFSARESPCIMCVQYIGGCSVNRGDILSTSGDIMIHVGE